MPMSRGRLNLREVKPYVIEFDRVVPELYPGELVMGLGDKHFAKWFSTRTTLQMKSDLLVRNPILTGRSRGHIPSLRDTSFRRRVEDSIRCRVQLESSPGLSSHSGRRYGGSSSNGGHSDPMSDMHTRASTWGIPTRWISAWWITVWVWEDNQSYNVQ
ncbi:hypothetical protein L1987_39687 [Smallanthus sonchifolius]|uniref:Uncharacterized protein n=1 Tax=Smallanthus sonchifolius TaxID=185202 RepID=A0ACB9HMQ0_9ASTR|nr:hypothetical protein L1987_39687 [Smallanthus sonchifolius]